MAEIDEVLTFARAFINSPAQRTPERRAKIKTAIRNLTGKILDNGCGTCYIEALFTILNFSTMASSKYIVKKGVVLQPFGHPEMSSDCFSITDEKGDWIMANQPELLKYFDKYPKPVAQFVPSGIEVIPPAKVQHSTDPKPIVKTARKKH